MLLTAPALTNLNAPTTAMLHALADGKPVSSDALYLVAAAACIEHEHAKAHKQGMKSLGKGKRPSTPPTRDDIVASGAQVNARAYALQGVRSGLLLRDGINFTMAPLALTVWTALHPPVVLAALIPAPRNGNRQVESSAVRRTKTTNQAVFGGMTEADAWVCAPLRPHTLVHFKVPESNLRIEKLRADLPAGLIVELDDMTSLYRVFGRADQDDAQFISDFLATWCMDNNVIIKGCRTEPVPSLRRRVAELPSGFWEEFCVFYGRYARGPARKHAASMKMHCPDYEDAQQFLNLWIVLAAITFDPERNSSFGAYLCGKIRSSILDLGRNKNGRVASDVEMHLKRAIDAFTHTNNRRPTDMELAEWMGLDVAVVRRNIATVSRVETLRSPQAIDYGPEGGEIPLPHGQDIDDEIMDETGRSLLSSALMAASAAAPTYHVYSDDPEDCEGVEVNPEANVLGWYATYAFTWLGITKQDIAAGTGTSNKNLKEHMDDVLERMHAQLSDA